MSSLPRVVQSGRCTLVGYPNARFPLNVCSGSRDALLLSQSNYRLPSGAWSGGGSFYVVKHSLQHLGKTSSAYRRAGGAYETWTQMGVSPGPISFSAPPLPKWNPEAQILQGYYPKGYALARPGRPEASVGQFLVELKDLPKVPGVALTVLKVPFGRTPVFLKARTEAFKNLGSQYLNAVFGWKPFVNDLRKMYNLWKKVDERMAQIVRENGKYIRRKATVKDDNTVTQQTGSYPWAFANVYGSPPSWANGHTYYTVTSQSKERVWFVGSFRYYIPDVGSSEWDKRARRALFGANPSPELLWEVLPWSWLIDWFSNVGDVVSNVSPNAVDNLTMRYSFIMRHVKQTTEWKANVFQAGVNDGWNYWPTVDQSFTTTSTVESKSRTGGGNPFGLNVSFNSLSGGQVAILAALGLSRSDVS